MMKSTAMVAGLSCVALSSGAIAQDAPPDRPSILVTGSGRAERPADIFTVAVEIEGRGRDQAAALQALAARQQPLMDGLRRLDGLTLSRLTTGQVAVQGAYDPECGGTGYQRDTSDCPVVGYVASMSLTLRAGPVGRAGDAVALAAELGASNASLSSTGVEDMSALQNEAFQAAFLDARRQADAFAAASGQRIVRVFRIQNPPEVRGVPVGREIAEVGLSGERVRPNVGLEVAPPPVAADARIAVIFEIE